MKKFFLLFTLALAMFGLNAQDLNEILDNHFEVIGQENVNKIKQITIYGTSVQMGTETPFTVVLKRPNKIRVDVKIQGMNIIQAYDGEKAWSVMPFNGSNDPVEVFGAQLDGMRVQSDMDGALYNWKEKRLRS